MKNATLLNSGLYLLLAAAGCYAADQPAVPDMIKATAAVRRVDAGLAGSKVRKAAKTFSGTPQMAVQTKTSTVKTSSTMPAANHPGGSVQTVVNVGSQNRRAQLVDAGGTQTAGSGVKTAAAAATTAKVVTIDSLAQFIAPVYGSTLLPQQTFMWTTGSGATRYALWVGSCQDCADLVDEDEGINLSRTLAMPLDGRRIYASLFTLINGTWYWVDYQFNAPYGDQPSAAQLITPYNGSTLGDPQNFTWQPGNRVDDYWIWLGSCFECNDLLNEDEGQGLSRSVNLPEDGRVIYLTLFSYIQGNWYYYDYEFRAPAPAPTQWVRINVTNQLAYPLDVYINGANVGSVPAFSTAGVTQALSSLALSFELEQPRIGSRILGDGFAGYFNTIYYPSGTYDFTINNVIGQDVFFAPVITNQTPAALEAEVNGGLDAENRCDCNVNGYTSNVLIGYYTLYLNSNVRMFLAGTNYTGPYIFWGQDANGNMDPSGPLYLYVAPNSGLTQLIATNVP